jgi:hypothetical protein
MEAQEILSGLAYKFPLGLCAFQISQTLHSNARARTEHQRNFLSMYAGRDAMFLREPRKTLGVALKYLYRDVFPIAAVCLLAAWYVFDQGYTVQNIKRHPDSPEFQYLAATGGLLCGLLLGWLLVGVAAARLYFRLTGRFRTP